MEINKTTGNGRLTLAITGRIDTKTAPELEKCLNESLDGISKLCFNLEKTEYISSAGLRVLLMAQKTMNKQGDMKVRNVSDDIMEIFEVTGFSDILSIV